MASAALQLIRASTASAHAALDASLSVARPEAGDEAYARYLEASLGFLEPLEGPLWSSAWPAGIEPALRTGKAAWVRADLSARGSSDGALLALPRRRSLPPLDSEAQRFGVAYVIEGAALGGQVLLRRLQPRLAPRPARFLEGYGRESAARWRAFVGVLGERLDERDAVVAAASARATFAWIHEWFVLRGVA